MASTGDELRRTQYARSAIDAAAEAALGADATREDRAAAREIIDKAMAMTGARAIAARRFGRRVAADRSSAIEID